MQEHTVARLVDIGEPGALEFTVGDGDWPFRGFIVRWQGDVYAYANTCPHAGHPLNLDPTGFFTPDQAQLICSSHGALFDPSTGACTGGPCAGAALHRLDCRVSADEILVKAPVSQRGFVPGQ